MTRAEFLNELKEALTEEFTPYSVEQNLLYYDDYIKTKALQDGVKEEEITAQLGEPRLIARTLIDTAKIKEGYQNHYQEEIEEENEREYDYKETSDQPEWRWNTRFSLQKIPWYKKAIAAVVTVGIILIVFFIGGLVFKLFITIGLPILIIYLLYRLIRNLLH